MSKLLLAPKKDFEVPMFSPCSPKYSSRSCPFWIQFILASLTKKNVLCCPRTPKVFLLQFPTFLCSNDCTLTRKSIILLKLVERSDELSPTFTESGRRITPPKCHKGVAAFYFRGAGGNLQWRIVIRHPRASWEGYLTTQGRGRCNACERKTQSKGIWLF